MRRLLTRPRGPYCFSTSKYSWTSGDIFNGYRMLSSQYHPDFDCHLHHLQHQATNSDVYHIEQDDPNNCFAPIVQTLTYNNKGAPHILEHLACCGSQKYPVRDPFFNMLKRSLSTYMNAWTGEDFTCYPFSSANAKDFQNLLKVYLDMVFKPKLSYLDFRQEGWRHQIENELLKYKGVVLNEMLGAYQSPDRKLMAELSKNLLAETPYSYDTGGQPSQIVNLQYDELVQMHKQFYEPSNMKFFAYGNQDIRKGVLPYLQQEYLCKLADKPTPVGKRIHNFNPKLLKSQSTISMKTPESQIILGYYLGELGQIPKQQLNALGMLSYLFFETNQAVFYEELIQKDIGNTFTNQYGLSPGKLTSFDFGVKRMQGSLDHQKFQQIVEKALQKVSSEGFASDRIDEVVHQIRISNAMPSRNNGLRLLQKLLTSINHRCDVHAELNYKRQLDQLQQLMKKPEYVASLINKYFLKNSHHSSVLLQSDNIKQTESSPEPKQGSADNDQVLKEQKQLASRQNSQVDNNVLPTLELSDINKHMQKYTIEKINLQGNNVSFVPIGDTGISHLRVIFRFKENQVSEEVCKALDLWACLMNKGLSTVNKSYKQFSKELSLHSTNFKVSVDHEPKNNDVLVVFSLAALHENLNKAAQLLGEVIGQVRFEPENMSDLLKAYVSDYLNDLVENVMDYAKSAACAGISDSEFRKSRDKLKSAGGELANQYTNGNQDACLRVLKSIHKLLVGCNKVDFAVHSPNKQAANAVKQTAFYLKPDMLPEVQPWKPVRETYYRQIESELYSVNCLAQVYTGPELYTEDSAHLSVFLQLLEQKYLHKEIREKGGAYGTSAGQTSSALLCLSSYLDPNTSRTLTVFQQCVKKLASELEPISSQELKEAKLSLFSSIDSPVVDYQRGLKQIIYGYTYEQLDRFRHMCLQATEEQIKKAARKYILDQPASSVSYGPLKKDHKPQQINKQAESQN